MSVAFRRESDEEHKEPRFELPLPAGPNLVTPAGQALIETRLADLERALDAAEGEAADAVRRDLRYWKTRRATAIVTAPPADGTVGFGSTVDIEMAGRRRSIAIVGDDEAEPKADRIAFTAPLARALIGGEAGERVAFGGKEDAILIVGVA